MFGEEFLAKYGSLGRSIVKWLAYLQPDLGISSWYSQNLRGHLILSKYITSAVSHAT